MTVQYFGIERWRLVEQLAGHSLPVGCWRVNRISAGNLATVVGLAECLAECLADAKAAH